MTCHCVDDGGDDEFYGWWFYGIFFDFDGPELWIGHRSLIVCVAGTTEWNKKKKAHTQCVSYAAKAKQNIKVKESREFLTKRFFSTLHSTRLSELQTHTR